MTRAIDLLKNSFGVSQLYQYDVKKEGKTIFTVYWNPLTIAERESIQKKSNVDDVNDYALALMITKALDENGDRLFQDGDKASLRREVEANILQEIQATVNRIIIINNNKYLCFFYFAIASFNTKQFHFVFCCSNPSGINQGYQNVFYIYSRFNSVPSSALFVCNN